MTLMTNVTIVGIDALLLGTLQVQAASVPQGSERKCADLANLKIANMTISEALKFPAGKPDSVPNPFAVPVIMTSLPEHCMVHGEVNHHKGADGKDYGDNLSCACLPTGRADSCSSVAAASMDF